MKNLKLFSILFLLSPVVFISCSKGTAGPAGPAGPDSTLHSAWIHVTMTFNTTDSAYEQAITAPAITKAVLDSGLVLSYLSYVNSAGNSFVFNASEGLNVTYTVDTIYLISTNDLSYANTGWSYRYVIVHGTVTTGNSLSSGPGKGYTKQQLLEMSYQDIKKLFGLQDNISSN